MGVPECKRKESKIEFERAYDRIYDDCFELIRINFGGEKELVDTYSEQIKQISDKLMQAVCDIGMYIKIANSIFPEDLDELKERRICQKKATGLCFFLLNQYESLMHRLRVKDNKLPIRQKIVRIRRRLKKYRELYDLGKLSEIKIRNCYKSRIYSLMKECNRCYKSVKSLNILYDKLFPIKEQEEKKSRKRLIYETFKEEKDLYEIYSACRQ